MRLHERTMPVQAAESDFRIYLARFQRDNDLTHAEMLDMLLAAAQDRTKYMLRRERHPDDPDKKADEA
ncbi:hypothetical protein ABZ949_01920 [Micromonospora tulbaghiae]|uniref:hypothetical protein n=1 Tax=Micromonospora tulbaghiae TaxID=479978 RepID=UPI0033FD8E67